MNDSLEEFLNNDERFLSWLDQHSSGYVLSTRPSRDTGTGTLHRRICRTFSEGTLKRHAHPTHNPLTGAGHGGKKVCTTDLDEMKIWIKAHLKRKNPHSCDHSTCSDLAI